jgi:hypothetical protein
MKQDVARMVREIMMEFGDKTGLTTSGNPPRRYLWTDAFAVCNFLELYRLTGDEEYRSLSLRLVDQVHDILGRHRSDDSRNGWISGLSEEEGRAHPTIGGLRIGKKMNERKLSEPFDEELEWDRDGQYYHYLAKWMHALNCASRVTGDPVYNKWAVELAKTAHSRFTYESSPGGQKRMCWKMSIDLSRPLVTSMGHHDPLDGLITYSQLQASASGYSEKLTAPDLAAEIADMAGICEGKSWVTDDPLGLGDLLCNAYRVAQLIVSDDFQRPGLIEILLDSSLQGLNLYMSTRSLEGPARYRLAFREFGLSIGLRAVERTARLTGQNLNVFKRKERLHTLIEALMRYEPVADQIEKFWLEDAHREAGTWRDNRDINVVMQATSLAPEGYLTIQAG